MKKVLLGILTLIPVIVLLVVAMVSNIVALQAHISVEDVVLRLKSTGEDAYDISLSFDSIRQKTFSITDYIDVVVYPQRANNYTLEYELSGDILYTDVEYEDNRNEYLQERAALTNQLEEEVSTGIFEDEKHREAFYIVRGKFFGFVANRKRNGGFAFVQSAPRRVVCGCKRQRSCNEQHRKDAGCFLLQFHRTGDCRKRF